MNTISKLLIYTFLILGFQILVLLSKSKTEIVTNSIEERYLRSDQIGPKFTKAYKKLNLRYEWLNDGIIIKNTEGESNLDTFIDGNTGESRILKRQASTGKTTQTIPLKSIAGWKPSPHSSDKVNIIFENQFSRKVRVFWVNFNGKLIYYGTIIPKGRLTISTFSGHVWVTDFTANDLTGNFRAAQSDCLAKLNSKSRNTAMHRSWENAKKDSQKKVFLWVKDHNIWIKLKGKQPIQLTKNGTEKDSYLKRFHFSPDEKFALGFRSFNALPVRKIPLISSSPKDFVHPKIEYLNYPKPGDPIPQLCPVIINLEKTELVKVEESSFRDSWSVQFKHWAADSRAVYVLYNRRGHGQLALRSIDPTNGKVKDIINETSDTFIDYSQKTMLKWLENSPHLIWASERDGWNHLYRIDVNNGKVINQITKGEWVVRRIEHIDEERGVIWFAAMGIHPNQDPYHIHLARVNLDGSNLRVLTQGDGTHTWDFNEKKSLFVDRWSRVDHGEIAELRRSIDGKLIKIIGNQDLTPLLREGYQMPIRFVAPGRDGKTEIHGIIIRPSNFDPNSSYPVIENIYAGPHDYHVPKKFGLQISLRRIAELGFILVKIDGMGTNWRSKEFHNQCWKNLADAGLPDRIAWLKEAAKKFPWLDLSRVGIYGGSAGGQNALAAMLHHGEFYKAAASDCGCHDNRMDKIWWNEAWMGKLGPHYQDNSNVFHAHKLKGKLMLTVGELDKNVDPASTLQVVNALVKSNKDFEFIMIPGAGHGIGEGEYLFRKRLDFFVRTLQGS